MSASTDPHGRSAAEIERDVERSRARVTDTIDELRTRMSPGQLVDQLADYAKGSGGAEFFRNLGGSVRDNPLPVLMIGAGVGWLMLSRGGERMPAPRHRALPAPFDPVDHQRDDEGDGIGTRISRRASAARDGAARATSAAGDAASDAASQTRAMAAEVAERAMGTGGRIADAGAALADRTSRAGSRAAQQARMRYHDTRDALVGAARGARSGWTWMIEERPLLLGAIGLAAGAALGALLPRTEAEDRLMGEASDAALRDVKAVAEEGYDRMSDVVDEQAGAMQETLSEAAGAAKDRIDRDGVAAAGAAAADAADRVASAAGDAVHAVSEEAKAAVVHTGSEASDGRAMPTERRPGEGDRPATPAQ